MRRNRVSHGHWPTLAASLAVVAGVSACSFIAPAPHQDGLGHASAFRETPAAGNETQPGSGTKYEGTGMPWLKGSGGGTLSPPGPSSGTPAASPERVAFPQYVDRTLPWLRSQPPKSLVPRSESQTVHVPRNWQQRSGDGPSAGAKPPPRQKMVAAAANPGQRRAVHLASYRSRAAAMSGWATLRDRYPQMLGTAKPILEDADLGAKGGYVRLLAGPFDLSSARSVCRNILARGGWCRQVSVQP